MDPDNPVIRLCVEGMQAEADERPDDAREKFTQAWERASDDYEACVAAHYVARHQTGPEETLRWNEECLRRADRVGDERVAGFYASLHLNLARAHGELGHVDEARNQLLAAETHLADVPAGPYGDLIRQAVANGLDSGRGQPTSGRREGPLSR